MIGKLEIGPTKKKKNLIFFSHQTQTQTPLPKKIYADQAESCCRYDAFKQVLVERAIIRCPRLESEPEKILHLFTPLNRYMNHKCKDVDTDTFACQMMSLVMTNWWFLIIEIFFFIPSIYLFVLNDGPFTNNVCVIFDFFFDQKFVRKKVIKKLKTNVSISPVIRWIMYVFFPFLCCWNKYLSIQTKFNNFFCLFEIWPKKSYDFFYVIHRLFRWRNLIIKHFVMFIRFFVFVFCQSSSKYHFGSWSWYFRGIFVFFSSQQFFFDPLIVTHHWCPDNKSKTIQLCWVRPTNQPIATTMVAIVFSNVLVGWTNEWKKNIRIWEKKNHHQLSSSSSSFNVNQNGNHNSLWKENKNNFFFRSLANIYASLSSWSELAKTLIIQIVSSIFFPRSSSFILLYIPIVWFSHVSFLKGNCNEFLFSKFFHFIDDVIR